MQSPLTPALNGPMKTRTGTSGLEQITGGGLPHAESRMKRDAPAADFKFRLYVAGDAQNSVQAVANLRALCRAHLPDYCEVEVIDVFKDPKRALSEAMFMTPTLIKYSPGAVRRIVGSLSQTATELDALGVESRAA